MAFDGDFHGAVPLVLPYTGHPDAAPVTRLVAHPLAGAYSFALAHNLIGAMHYQVHPSTYTLVNTTAVPDDFVFSSTLVVVGNVEGYVPTWAERIHARVLFTTGGDKDAVWSCRVSTPGDTGSIYTGTINRQQGNLHDLATLWYPEFDASAQVAMSGTTLGDDVVCTVSLSLVSTEEDSADRLPSLAKLLGVYVWWEANHG